MRKVIMSIVVIVALVASMAAQQIFEDQKGTNNRGTTGFTFLKNPVSARLSALGETAFAGDKTAASMFANVAELPEIKSASMFYTNSSLYGDLLVQNSFAVGVKVSERIAIGAFARTLKPKEPMEITTIAQPEGTGYTYEYSDTDMGVAFGYRATKRFSIGVKVHMVSEQIDQSKASAFLFDIGTDYRISYANIRIAALLENFGADAKFEGNNLWQRLDDDITSTIPGATNVLRVLDLTTKEFAPPTRIILSVKGDIIGENSPLKIQDSILSLYTGLLKTNDQFESFQVGMEYIYTGLTGVEIALRGGTKMYREEDYDAVYTVGGGLSYMFSENYGIVFDYAYRPNDILDETHMFSLGMLF